MKNTLLVLFITIMALSCLQLNAINDIEAVTVKQIKILDSSVNHTTLEFTLPEYEVEIEDLNGIEFDKIVTECDGFLPVQGLPELPVFSTMIAIPYQGSVSLEVMNKTTHTLSNFSAIPAQDYTVENPSERSFSYDADFYNSNDIYPTENESLSDPMIVRDFRVVALSFSPFTYNPATRSLEVADRIVYKLNYNNEPGGNESETPIMYSPSFVPVYKALIANYDEVLDREIPFHNKRILIIYGNSADQNYLNKLDEFVTWKKQKGFVVATASTATTGTSTSSVKAYIQTAYNNIATRPEYVILIGDTSGSLEIDCFSVGGGSSDYPYQQLAGGASDTLGDIFIGRMPVENVTDFLTMANKVFIYERDTVPLPPTWYNSMLLVGYSGASGQSVVYVNKFYKYAGLRVNPNYTFTEIYGSPTSTGMQNAINSGVAFFVYRGYIGMNGWDTPSEASFTNGNKMSHSIILTCSTGNFSGTDAIDSIVRYGSPAAPKGAITAVGMATSGTHTLMNNVLSSQIGDSIFNRGMRDIGAPLLTAKLLLYMIYHDYLPSYVINFPGWCNLMGDPTVEVWVGVPQPIVAEYPAEVFPGQTCYPVHVKDNAGNPMIGADVTILNNNLQLIMETDENGNAVFELPGNLANNDSFVVTISQHDHVPVFETIDVVAVDGINVTNAVFTGGNNDGNPDAGETLDVSITLNNPGTSAINGAVVEMSTDSPYITIVQNSAAYGDLVAGASVTNTTPYQIQIAGNAPVEYQAAIRLDIAGQNYTTYMGLEIHNADIAVNSIQLNDTNGLLEPGETTTLTLSLINNGTIAVDNITAELLCESELIILNDNEAVYGDFTPSAVIINGTDEISITARNHLLSGYDVEFTLHIFNDNGYDTSQQIYIPTGTPDIGSPTGPDAYGHFIYHSADTNWIESPEYNWIEIAPAEGGPGTQFTSITDNGTDGGDGDITGADTIDNTNLPFDFRFYGVDYDEVYICSNGFFTFLPTEVGTFRNFPIPGPMCPDPLIAPFWDDLVYNQTGSGIFHWYDSVNHLFVIEWYNARNGFDTSYTEQFQAILYDPEYHSTATGDGKIKLQYHTFNDIDAGNTSSYPPTCGQFSTIGVSDHTGTDGIQYVFDLEYAPTAQPITDGTALLISGEPYLNINPYLVYEDVAVTEANGNGFNEPGEFIDIDISIMNMGLTDATNVTATISSTDPNIGIMLGTVNYSFIAGSDGTSWCDTPFSVMISPIAPNQYVIPLTLTLETEDDSWVMYTSLTVTSPHFEILDAFIYDSASGNGNGVPNIDETLDLVVNIYNPGLDPMNNVTTNFYCQNNPLTIVNATQQINSIPALTGNQLAYTIQIPSTITNNSFLYFVQRVQGTGTIITEKNITLQVNGQGDLIPAGKINGTISVDSGTPDFTEALVSSGEYTNTVLGDGTYSLFAPYGTYSLTGELNYYTSDLLNSITLTPSVHNLDNNNFNLLYLAEPTALDGSFNNGELTLNWTAPVTDFTVTNYNVYRKINNSHSQLISTTEGENYLDNLTQDGEYFYYVEAVYPEGIGHPSIQYTFDTAVALEDDIINKPITALYGNYPNPFNPTTTISYSLATEDKVTIEIFNIKGQLVKTLINEIQSIGSYSIKWNGKDNEGKDCASGLYMYRFQTKGINTVKKAMLLK